MVVSHCYTSYIFYIVKIAPAETEKKSGGLVAGIVTGSIVFVIIIIVILIVAIIILVRHYHTSSRDESVCK